MAGYKDPDYEPPNDDLVDIRPGIKTVEDAYRALAEAIVAQAFKDYIAAQKLLNKGLGYRGRSVPMSEYTRSVLYYGREAETWLLNTDDASFYAGFDVNIVRLFDMVADQLKKDGLEIAKNTYPFMRRN